MSLTTCFRQMPWLAGAASGRLAVGSPAPALTSVDLAGRPVSLAEWRGRPVLVAFFRYATCPFCNLRVHELRRAWPRLQTKGLRIVAVFQSPAATMREHVGRQEPEFPLVADPTLRLYREWGVEQSWLGLLGAGVMGAGSLFRAFRTGYRPGRVDGPLHRMPADFLVGADGRLREVLYGRHAGDHLPLARIHELLDGTSSRARAN